MFKSSDPSRKIHHAGKMIGVRHSQVVEAANIATQLPGPVRLLDQMKRRCLESAGK